MALIAVLMFAAQIGFLVLVVVGARKLLQPGTTISAADVRQFFQYALMYGLVIIVSIGASELLSRLLGAAPESWDTTDTSLAMALGFVVVGSPLLGVLVWWTRRKLRADTRRENSVIYAAYLTFAALTALLVTAFNLGPLLGHSVTGSFEASSLAAVLVWGAVWAAHWLVAERTISEARNTPHLLLGSAAGLLFAAAGFVASVQGAADTLASTGFSFGFPTQIMIAAGVMTTGALIWVRYWVTRAQKLPRGRLWMLFTLPLGVGGGLVTGLGAAGVFLWEVLVWFLGDPGSQDAATYFSDSATEMGVALTGLLAWWYFRTVLSEQVTTSPVARRIYLYLVAAISLGTAAVGAVVIIGAFIEALVPTWRMNTSPTNTLLGGLVLLALGAVTWWVFWRRVQNLVLSDPDAEERAPARRIYLLAWVWGGGVAAVIALIYIAVQAFQVVVSGVSFQAALYSSRFALGTLLVASVLSVYHGLQHKPGAKEPLLPRSVTVIGQDQQAIVELREAMRTDTTIHSGAVLLEVADMSEAAARLRDNFAAQDVVVLVRPGGAEPDGPIG